MARTKKKKTKKNRGKLLASDSRAITNPAMDKELKRLGLTIQDLIDAENKMKPNSPHYNWKGKRI